MTLNIPNTLPQDTYKGVLKQMLLEESAGLSPFYSQLHHLDDLPVEILGQFVRHLAVRLGPHMPPTSVFNQLDSILEASSTNHDNEETSTYTSTPPLLSTTEHIDPESHRIAGEKAPRLLDNSLPTPKKIVKFSEPVEILHVNMSKDMAGSLEEESSLLPSRKASNLPAALAQLYALQERLKKEEELEQKLDEKISTYKYEAKGWQSRYDAMMANFRKEEVQLQDVGYQMKKDILNENREREKLVNQKRRAEIERERLMRLASKAGVVIANTPVKRPLNGKRER